MRLMRDILHEKGRKRKAYIHAENVVANRILRMLKLEEDSY